MNNKEKRLLLMKMLSKKNQQTSGDSDLLVRSGKNRFPLSMVQKGIWLDCQLDQESVVYNIPFACKLVGKVDVEVIKESIFRILDRHESWRTVIRQENDEVFQEVLAEPKLDFSFFDMIGENVDDDKVAEIGKKFVSQPIDLENGPLVRFALYQTKENTFYLILVAHHIVYDGSSASIFGVEFSAEYSAILNGQKSSVEEPKISYGDFAEQCMPDFESKSMISQINYWKEELIDLEPVEFPTDHVRPSIRKDEGGIVYFDMDDRVDQLVRKYALDHQCTVNAVLVAAFSCLLANYSGSNTPVMGTTVANRDRKEIENLLGCFINNLVIKTNVKMNMTFNEIAKQTQNKLFAAYANKDVPLSKLIEVLNPPHDLSRTPFYEVGFNYNPRTSMNMNLPNCQCEMFKLGDFHSLVDVNVQVYDDGKCMSGFVEYNKSLYDRSTIESIIERFGVLIDRYLTQSQTEIGKIKILSDLEEQQILEEFNNTYVSYPKDKTMIEVFEEQVRKTPDRIAIVFENETLTYAQVNEKANSLAVKLRAMGIKRDDFVVLSAERSEKMLLGILGILKSGGAYVPVDPTYPEDRIRYMLADCTPKAAVVYDAMEVKKILQDEIGNERILDLDADGIWDGEKDNLPLINEPGDLAYCIYTSGTTGK